MIERKVSVANKTGIHARPAAHIVKLATQFDANIKLIFNNKTVDAKSIVGVMSLAAQEGQEIVVLGEGPQAEAAVNALVDLLSKPFEE